MQSLPSVRRKEIKNPLGLQNRERRSKPTGSERRLRMLRGKGRPRLRLKPRREPKKMRGERKRLRRRHKKPRWMRKERGRLPKLLNEPLKNARRGREP